MAEILNFPTPSLKREQKLLNGKVVYLYAASYTVFGERCTLEFWAGGDTSAALHLQAIVDTATLLGRVSDLREANGQSQD